jgi:hypothetical protein
MGYEVKPDGTIIASTVEEALALQRRILQQTTEIYRPVEIPPAQAGPNVASHGAREKGLQFLRIIADNSRGAGKKGIPALSLAQKLDVDPKALSFYVRAAKFLIQERSDGKSTDKFLWKERGQDGTMWHADTDRLREIGIVLNFP